MNKRVMYLLAAALLLGSCLLFPRTRLDVLLYDPVDPQSSWSLGSVRVERKTMDGEIARMVPEIMVPLAHLCKLPLSTQQESGGLRLDIGIIEREFTRGLDTLNSISYTATLYESGSGRQLAQAIYSEESKETIASSYHLYAVSEKILKGLAARLAKQAKDNG